MRVLHVHEDHGISRVMSAADVKELATQGFEQTISSTEELVISLRGEEKNGGEWSKKGPTGGLRILRRYKI